MTLDRRRFLKLTTGALAVGGLGAIAGCSSSCPDSDDPTPDEYVSIEATETGGYDEPPGGTWRQSHGDAGRTGFADGALPGSDLAVRWRTGLEMPLTDSGSLSASAPTVGNGTVVVADSQRVHALSLETGEALWQTETPSPTPREGVVEDDADTVAPTIGPQGNVYVGAEEGLVVLDGSDGSVRWRDEELRNVGSPAILGETVFALGASTIAVSDLTGGERWRRSIERQDASVPPGVDEATVVVATDDGVRAFDTATSEQRWQSRNRLETHPVLVDGTCYLGNFDGLHAIDATSGEELWSFRRGDARAMLSPVVTPDTIYAVEQPAEAGAASFALDRTGGEPEPRWCSKIGDGTVTAATDDFALTSLTIGRGSTAPRGIVAFSKSFGEAPWAIEGGHRPRDWLTPPAVLDGTVITSTRGGVVTAISGGGGSNG